MAVRLDDLSCVAVPCMYRLVFGRQIASLYGDFKGLLAFRVLRILISRSSGGREGERMCRLKLRMVEEPKPLRSSHRKPTCSSSEDIHINMKTPSKSTDISGGSSLLSKASSSSTQSLASFRDSLPENPNIYRYRELADATAKFASRRLGKSFVWKCVLRGKTVVVTVRNRMREIRDCRSGLREICNAHHASIVNLLGGCCEGENAYLV